MCADSDTEVADASLAAMLQHMQSTDEHSKVTHAERNDNRSYNAYGGRAQGNHNSLQQVQRVKQRAELGGRLNKGHGGTTVRGPDESCKTCKGARGICRKWNTPGHLYEYPSAESSSSRDSIYDRQGQPRQPGQGGNGGMSISSLAAAAAASGAGSDGSAGLNCVSL